MNSSGAILRCRYGCGSRSYSNVAQAKEFARTVDIGEAEAIELALELRADRLLIDERKGRRLASQEGVPVIGLLGVVLLSRQLKLIPSARILIEKIEREAGMYLDRNLKESALKTVDE